MTTDLKERTSSRVMETIVLQKTERRSRWSLVFAAAILLSAVFTGGVLVLTQNEPSGSFPSLSTEFREGSGYAQVDTPAGFTGLGAPRGAREADALDPTGFDPAEFADAPGRGHVIPRPPFDPDDYAQYAGTGHVAPQGTR